MDESLQVKLTDRHDTSVYGAYRRSTTIAESRDVVPRPELQTSAGLPPHPETRVKILAILSYYAPHWTGLTRHAQILAEELVARGHEVTVLCVRHEPSLAVEETLNGVRVVRVRPWARLSRGFIAPAFPASAAKWITWADVVQIHTPLPEAALVALLCRVIRRPLMMTHHGDVVMPHGAFNRFVEWSAGLVLKTAGRLADVVTTYSLDYAENSPLLRSFGGKLVAIPPPVPTPPEARDGTAKLQTRLRMEGGPVIGIAGRWVEEKGFDYLLKALPLLCEKFPGVQVVHAGGVDIAYERFFEQCRNLVEQHSGRLTFLGLLEDSHEMAAFYRMCDVFVLPSRSDMFALVQLEALLCGTPVVATDIPGARVVVRETGMGLLAPPRDADALACTITAVLNDRPRFLPDVRRVRALFGFEASVDKYEETLRIMVGFPDRNRAPTLNAHDMNRLATLLRNEADMAFRRRAMRMAGWLELRDGERILDCGCGMGFYLMLMSRLRKLTLVGLDGDGGRLAWARRERVPASLAHGDIENLPFREGCFDKVLMSEVLEHLQDDVQGLRELFRILRPGGVLVLSVPHARYPFGWDPINRIWIALGGQPIRRGPIAGIWSNHERLYEPLALASAVRAAGFEVEVIEEATHHSFPLIHFLVYGIGKPLLEGGFLPTRLRKNADRFSGERNQGSWLNPINFGVAILRWFDRPNDRRTVGSKKTFVNVLLKARKPEAIGDNRTIGGAAAGEP